MLNRADSKTRDGVILADGKMDRPLYSVNSRRWVGHLEWTRGNKEVADLNPVLAVSLIQSDGAKPDIHLSWHLIQ